VSLPAFPQGIASVLFLVMLRESVENTRLTALLSRRSLTFNLTVAVGTLAFGVWLEKVAFPLNYQVMFLAAFALSLMSYLNVQRVQTLAPEPLPLEPGAVVSVKPWKSPSFQRVAFICMMMHISFFTLAPIIPLHLVNELGAQEGFMSVFAVAELGAAATMAMFTSRIVRRIGTRPTIAAGMFITAVSSLVLALTPYLPITLIASALSGAGWTMAAISLFAFFSESTPADNLTPYMTLYNQIVMLAIFIGPMVGSQLASSSIDLTAVLLIGTGLRVIAALLIPLDLFGRPTRQRRLSRRAV
jgi:predicted MFS family arabinose efflux permease